MRLIAASFVLVLVSASALAQSMPCAKRAELLAKLSKDYGESPVALGLTPDGNVIEVMASKSGSWTMVVSTPQGLSCGVASGESWSVRTSTPPAEEGRPL